MLVAYVLPSIACLLLIKFLRQWITYRRAINTLPGSQDLHPLLGNLHTYPGQGEAGMTHDFDNAQKYKYFNRFWIGPFLTLMVYHPESVRTVINSNATKPRNRSRIFSSSYDMGAPWLGEGLVMSNGARWQRNRRLLTPSFHFDILKSYIDVYNSCCDIFMSEVRKIAKPNGSFDLQPLVSRLVRDVVLRCAFSYNSNCQSGATSSEYINIIDELGALWIDRCFNPLHIIELVYRFSSKGRRYHNLCGKAHREAEKIIEQRQSEINMNPDLGGKKKARDFLDTLLTARDEDGNGLTREEIRDEVDTFLFAGHDTTTSGILWTLMSLAQHRKYQQLVYEEVKDVLGDRDHVVWEDLGQLQYTGQCIKEALRVHGAVPGIDRITTRDIVLNGHNIPEGTPLSIHLWALHNNPHVWDDPRDFQPHRFDPDRVAKMDPFQFIPFSAGSRNCIGQNFAMNEMKVVVAKVIRQFRLEADPDKPPERFMSITMKATNGAYIYATPRSL